MKKSDIAALLLKQDNQDEEMCAILVPCGVAPLGLTATINRAQPLRQHINGAIVIGNNCDLRNYTDLSKIVDESRAACEPQPATSTPCEAAQCASASINLSDEDIKKRILETVATEEKTTVELQEILKKIYWVQNELLMLAPSMDGLHERDNEYITGNIDVMVGINASNIWNVCTKLQSLRNIVYELQVSYITMEQKYHLICYDVDGIIMINNARKQRYDSCVKHITDLMFPLERIAKEVASAYSRFGFKSLGSDIHEQFVWAKNMLKRHPEGNNYIKILSI